MCVHMHNVLQDFAAWTLYFCRAFLGVILTSQLGELLLSVAAALYSELKGSHKSVAYLAFCGPECLTVVLSA